jgi:hypothetical protein
VDNPPFTSSPLTCPVRTDFLPGYLFTALSWFSWVTWIAPTNVPVNQMFGYFNGLGMSVITFDWTQITATGSPLATPWWVDSAITESSFAHG